MVWRCEREGAGALRDLVTVERIKADAEVDAFGEVPLQSDVSWETHCQEWAEIHFHGGSESGQPTQQVGLREWRMRVRFNADTLAITSLMRVRLPEGAVLNILAVGDPDRMRRWIEITAGEKAT